MFVADSCFAAWPSTTNQWHRALCKNFPRYLLVQVRPCPVFSLQELFFETTLHRRWPSERCLLNVLVAIISVQSVQCQHWTLTTELTEHWPGMMMYKIQTRHDWVITREITANSFSRALTGSWYLRTVEWNNIFTEGQGGGDIFVCQGNCEDIVFRLFIQVMHCNAQICDRPCFPNGFKAFPKLSCTQLVHLSRSNERDIDGLTGKSLWMHCVCLCSFSLFFFFFFSCN